MSNTANIEIDRARPTDLEQLISLLNSVGLPTEGFADHLDSGLVARDGSSVVGSAELEIYASSALLRSVAVATSAQGLGLGTRLVEASLALAKARGIRRVFLLTETAEEYFPRFGFHNIRREDVDDAVKGSVEFTNACSEDAKAMVLEFD